MQQKSCCSNSYKLSSILFSTTCAEISRFAASGITMEVGDSITSSVTIMFLLTGRQCMKKALLVTAMWRLSTVHDMSLLSTLP